MNTNREEPAPKWRASVSLGRWALAIPAGASFACLLTLMRIETPDYSVKIATICFAAALPLLGQYVLVLNDESRGHHTSVPMRVFAVLGFLFFIIGFVAMLSRISVIAAAVFGFFSLAMVFVLSASQERAKKAADN
jgi:hypothetical protein